MVDAIWQPLLAASLGPNREEGRKATMREVEHWCLQRPNGQDLLAEFIAIGTTSGEAA
jgi:hypothetical protein